MQIVFTVIQTCTYREHCSLGDNYKLQTIIRFIQQGTIGLSWIYFMFCSNTHDKGVLLKEYKKRVPHFDLNRHSDIHVFFLLEKYKILPNDGAQMTELK